MGTLYVCATPIGNLEDVSIRLLKTLRRVDIIACEDTRQTSKLLQRYHIRKRLVSYHQHNRRAREELMVGYLREGKDVALVSDAGMPAISDPGEDLVRSAIREGFPVVVVPGPSALVSALALSGMDTTRFVFEGFLPAKASQRRDVLASLAAEPRTAVFYEAPHRLLETLEDMEAIMGERQIAVARELTKLFEEVVRGTVIEVRQHFATHPPRGEITIIIEGNPGQPAQVDRVALLRELEELIASGVEKKEAFKIKAREYGLKKRDIYRLFVDETDSS
ncbi:MAG: 16S rRNA (cytidine(1402)-2'-O)-methyltransferase [Syntrophomonadaceae bacterium]|nr:16S rRNA (cytidine(1402)-2'-O)-methyltransferase [Syntrophomonadaceae bacterium]